MVCAFYTTKRIIADMPLIKGKNGKARSQRFISGHLPVDLVFSSQKIPSLVESIQINSMYMFEFLKELMKQMQSQHI